MLTALKLPRLHNAAQLDFVSHKIRYLKCNKFSSFLNFFYSSLDLIYLFCEKVNETAEQDFTECVKILFDDTAEPAVNNFSEPIVTDDDEDERLRTKNQNKEPESLKASTTSEKPRILFSFYFSHVDSNHIIEHNLNKASIPANLHLVGGSREDLDFDYQVSQVR